MTASDQLEQTGEFDSEAHALYVSLFNPGPFRADPTWGIVTREIAPGVMGDYLPDGTLVGVEFLSVEYVHTYSPPTFWDRVIPARRWPHHSPWPLGWLRRHVYDDRTSPLGNVKWKWRRLVCVVRGHAYEDWISPPWCKRCLHFGSRVSLNPTPGNPPITTDRDHSS